MLVLSTCCVLDSCIAAERVCGHPAAHAGALADCRRLRRLDLARNCIEDIMPLRSLDALTLLGLEGNRLASLHGAFTRSPTRRQQATHGLLHTPEYAQSWSNPA